MTRNDGYLYTGVNSVTSERQSVRERVKKQKEEAQQQLAPIAEVIFERIDREKNKAGEMLAGLLDSSMTDSEVRTHVEAVKLHRAWVQEFELQLKADLRRGRAAEAKDE